jgi:hypothetical protein
MRISTAPEDHDSPGITVVIKLTAADMVGGKMNPEVANELSRCI